jgi:hypothetical protein
MVHNEYYHMEYNLKWNWWTAYFFIKIAGCLFEEDNYKKTD